jgi:hypothetical protein
VAEPLSRRIHWHSLPAADPLRALASRVEGLAEREARLRLSRIGPNAMLEPRRRGALVRFMATLNGGAVYVKCAPKRVLAFCTHQLGTTSVQPLVRQWRSAQIDAAAANGRRAFQLAFTYLPVMLQQIGTAEIHATTWGFVVLSGVAAFPPVELENALWRWLRPPGAARVVA